MDADTLRGFSLLETLRLEDGDVVRQERHLSRMGRAAARCGFPWHPERAAEALQAAAVAHPTGRWRLRLLVGPDGAPTVQTVQFAGPATGTWRVGFAPVPVADDPFLRMKTTRRGIYDAARASRPDLDDVLLVSEAGLVTESTIANVVVELDGRRWTPPATLPLLPGVFRGLLLETGQIHERPLTRDDVASASRLWLVNSLREWMDARLEND